MTWSPRMVMYFHQVVDIQDIIPKADALSIRYVLRVLSCIQMLHLVALVGWVSSGT